MTGLKIRLLGQFSVSLDNTPVTSYASDKVRALFAYLVTEAQCPHRREILANLLWSDQPEETCRANLRRALSDLRKCIHDHDADPPYLLVSRQDIQFNSESSAWVDLAELDLLYRAKEFSHQDHRTHLKILDLYQGEFLEGFTIPDSLYFNEWALMIREQQNRKMISVLARIASYYEKRQEFEQGLPFAWKLVELDPWQEEIRRQLMRLLVHTGKRHEAIKQYLDLTEQLRENLDIEPDVESTALYNLIKAGELPTSPEQKERGLPAFITGSAELRSGAQEVFVGRREELEKLNPILDAMLAGQGGLRFIAGEAGSGKSMLTREFVRRAQLNHPTLVSAAGFCNPFSGIGDPYLPFREILSQLCGNVEHAWSTGVFRQPNIVRLWNAKPAAIKELVLRGDSLLDTLISSQALLNTAASLEDTHPGIFADLLALIERKTNQPEGTPPQPSIFTHYTAVLKSISKEFPLLLVVDDLQWADTGTIGLLFHLGRHLADSRVMLIGAYRSEEVSIQPDGSRHPMLPVLSELQKEHGDITICLDRASDETFVDDLLASEPNDLDHSFRDSLLAHTNGHPLFTVELLRDLQENGTLARNNAGRWAVKQNFQISKLPPKIEGIIGERISRLPNILQDILAAACIEGESFTAEVIADLEDLPIPQVLNLLSSQLDKQHRLVRAQQIKVDEEKTISTYKFRHILFQKYLYDQLDAIEKTSYHARVGASLENLVGEEKESFAVHLARHFHKANQVEKATLYYQIAGSEAVRMSGHLEAIVHFEKALELLLSMPASTQRDQQELGLQLQVGLAYQATQGYACEQVGTAFQRAWELSQIVEDVQVAKQSFQLLYSYYANIAQLEIAKEIKDLDDQNLDRTTQLGNLEFYWGNGYLDLCFGKIESAFDKFTNMLRYYDLEKTRSYVQNYGMEAGILGNGHAAVLAAHAGYPERARGHIQKISHIAKSWQDSGIVQTDAMWYSAWAFYEIGDYEAAKDYLETAMALAEKYGIFWIQAFQKLLHGRLLSLDGDHKTAIATIKTGLDILNMIGFIVFKPFFFLGLAEAYQAAGMKAEGLETVLEAENFANQTGAQRFSAPIQKIKGDLLLNSSEPSAEEAYLDSIQIARQQGAKMLELQAAIALSRLWIGQGKQEQAFDLIQPIYDWFTEGYDTPWLVEAREILGAIPTEI